MTFTGCQIKPYVNAVQTGQEILINNIGDILHNVHLTPVGGGNREVNLAMMPNGPPLVMSLPSPEIGVRLKCDVHPWEFSYISSFDHPFFGVTDRNGHFRFPVPPEGDYNITAFHRKSGSIHQKVRVTKGKLPEINFTFVVPAGLQAGAN